jgi:hypothetical protein
MKQPFDGQRRYTWAPNFAVEQTAARIRSLAAAHCGVSRHDGAR